MARPRCHRPGPAGEAWAVLGLLARGQRCNAGRKREVVLRLMRGEPAGLLSTALQRVGDVTMENELLRATVGRPGLVGRRRLR